MANSKHDRISIFRTFSFNSVGALLEKVPYLEPKVPSATTYDLYDSYDMDTISILPRHPSITSLPPAGAKVERTLRVPTTFDGGLRTRCEGVIFGPDTLGQE